MTELASVKDVSVSYGRFSALRGVSVSVAAGSIHAIIGEHGAGKSTLARLLSGQTRPDSGTIEIDGKAFNTLSPEIALRSGVRMVFQEGGWSENLTIDEYFNLNEPSLAPPGVVESMLRSFDLDYQVTLLLGEIREADRILLSILKCLFWEPKLLVLDEVLQRLSEGRRRQVMDALAQLKARGGAVLLITHYLDDIFQTADTVTVLKSGRILLTENVQDVDHVSLIRLTYTNLPESGESYAADFYRLLKYNEAILRMLPISLVVTDSRFIVRILNERARDFFVCDATFAGKRFSQLLEGSPEESQEILQSKLETGDPFLLYRLPLRINGSEIHAKIGAYPIIESGKREGTIVTFEDVTDYERLRDSVHLSENLSSLGLIAFGIAHEINNPLGIMQNYLQGMKLSAKDPETVRKTAILEDQIAYIAKIVGKLISFSDNRTVTEEVGVDTEIQGLVSFIGSAAERQSIRIVSDLKSAPYCVRMQQQDLRQVLLNLIKNSMEATPTGGEITIRTETVDVSSPVIVITIEDTGTGIKEEHLSEIFLPFFSTKRGLGKNSGLGLSIVYGIVSKYGGTVEIGNKTIGGVKSIVRLPVASL